MNAKSKGIVMGTGGLFAGLLSAQLVSWSTGPKAFFATAVCVIVSLILHAVLPQAKPDSQNE
ncbi:MAG: hypothetical protein JJU05_09300 [Verrucomicrobia bacterium]|nr:hypothetical protein [Verrucomicrobiota bacterium]MCH8527594.1 hypothetical protein [Kiritimatiellia bacterium]